MWYSRPVAIGLAVLLPSVVSGGSLDFVGDPQKESGAGTVQGDPKVRALRTEFDALAHRMSFWKLRDFEAVFGPPIRPVRTDYALTCTQPRLIVTGGVGLLGDEDNKSHTGQYAVGDRLRADVRFQRDGVTPSYVIFYLRTGAGFVRLDRADQLEARVTWERAVLWKSLKHVDERWREVVGWEVDRAEFDRLYNGREDLDPDAKLRADTEWGEKEKLQLYRGKGQWEWYRGEARVAKAYGRDDATPTHFILLGPNGRSVRDDSGGPGSCSIRWNRPDGSSYRSESWERDGASGPWRAVGWYWSTADGRGGRAEKDTNGDGVPDEVWVPTGEKQASAAPLKVEHSWAIHPELIPVDLRVADQPDRRLPVRRIPQQ